MSEPDPAPGPIPGRLNPRPITGHAVQFDGTIDALLTIFGTLTGNTDGVFLSIQFGPNNTIRQVTMSGAANITMNNRDWLILPNDGAPMRKVTNDEFIEMWEELPASQIKRKSSKSPAKD
jgi:hypothetical protein